MSKLLPKKKKKSEGRSPRIINDPKPNVFRYSANRSQGERTEDRGKFESTQSLKDKINKLFRQSIFVGAVAIFILISVYLSLASSEPKLQIDGNLEIRAMSEYEKAAAEAFQSKPKYRFKPAIDGQAISVQLQKRFPELKLVSVSTPIYTNKPVVKIILSRPAVLFSANSGTYLIDERGIAISNVSTSKPKLETDRLLRLNDQTNYPVSVNKPVLTSRQIVFMHEIQLQSKARNLEIETMNLVAGGGELDVKYKSLPYLIKLNFYENARKSIGTFIASKEQFEKDGISPGEYIDVRIPGRAYVR